MRKIITPNCSSTQKIPGNCLVQNSVKCPLHARWPWHDISWCVHALLSIYVILVSSIVLSSKGSRNPQAGKLTYLTRKWNKLMLMWFLTACDWEANKVWIELLFHKIKASQNWSAFSFPLKPNSMCIMNTLMLYACISRLSELK